MSSIKEFDGKDDDGFFSKTYSIYVTGTVIVCSTLIFSSKIIARLLFSKGFYEAWRYVPFLSIAVVFMSSASFLGGIFIAAKKPRILGISTLIAALINVGLNIILIHQIGTIGAAIATSVSYVFIWMIRVLRINNVIVWKVNWKRDILVYICLFVESFFLLNFDGLLLYVYMFLCLLMIAFLLKKEISIAIKNAQQYVENRLKS